MYFKLETISVLTIVTTYIEKPRFLDSAVPLVFKVPSILYYYICLFNVHVLLFA